jgi:hypothetical protein
MPHAPSRVPVPMIRRWDQQNPSGGAYEIRIHVLGESGAESTCRSPGGRHRPGGGRAPGVLGAKTARAARPPGRARRRARALLTCLSRSGAAGRPGTWENEKTDSPDVAGSTPHERRRTQCAHPRWRLQDPKSAKRGEEFKKPHLHRAGEVDKGCSHAHANGGKSTPGSARCEAYPCRSSWNEMTGRAGKLGHGVAPEPEDLPSYPDVAQPGHRRRVPVPVLALMLKAIHAQEDRRAPPAHAPGASDRTPVGLESGAYGDRHRRRASRYRGGT